MVCIRGIKTMNPINQSILSRSILSRSILSKIKIPTALILSTAGLLCGINSVSAQSNTPTCQAPRTGEYLLLVVSPTKDNQTQLKRVLPTKIETNTCKYLNDTVTRIGGFKKIDDANRWARYIKDSAGLSAIITTRPTGTPTPSQAGTQRPQASTVSYKPRRSEEHTSELQSPDHLVCRLLLEKKKKKKKHKNTTTVLRIYLKIFLTTLN